jgi:TATA-box binding protein (TBP) (component of TFIID and TFIIIB)
MARLHDSTSFAYIQKLNRIRAGLINDQSPDPSWVRITTITMCSKFLEAIDLPKFRENFRKLETVYVRPKGSRSRGFAWKMKETAFYNQVTIGYEDHSSRKSIKLFPNGSIQVAGCADLFDCRRILKQLSFILMVVLGKEAVVPVDEVSVKMINTNFSLNSSVNLLKIIGKLSKAPGGPGANGTPSPFKVTFDPDRYSAVKVKFVPKPGQKQVTASIFSTGKIIVTGAQTLDEIAEAYSILNQNLRDPAILIKPSAQPELFDNIMGATFGEWHRVLEEHSSLGLNKI